MFEQKSCHLFLTQIFPIRRFNLGSCNRFFLLSVPKAWVRAADWKRSSTVSRASDFELKLKALFFLCLQEEDTKNSGKRVYMLCRETEKVEFFQNAVDHVRQKRQSVAESREDLR